MNNLTGDYQTLRYRVDRAGDKTVREILYDEMGISARLYRSAKWQGAISVNGHVISLAAKARAGDVIELKMIEADHAIEPEPIPLTICYEDQDILAVDKAVNIVAHPTKGVTDGTLSNAVRHYALSQGEDYKPRLINRLDRDTTGIILFAKNPYAQHRVSAEFMAGRVDKFYYALAHGKFNKNSETINLPIGLAEGSRIKREVRADGKPAITHYRVIEQYDNSALLKVKLETGRTHQIRVHLSAVAHPLVGDDLYGSFEKIAIARQALHACQMSFVSPRNGRIEISSDLPADMMKAIAVLA